MKLADDERDLLLAELDDYLAQEEDPERREQFERMRELAAAGDVPEDRLHGLTLLVELGLESGQIRRRHTAHGEMAALRFYRRTPRGRAIQQSLDAVSEALSGLAGQALEEISVSLAGPGKFTLAISTDQGRMLVHLDRSGAELRSVEIG